MDHKNSIVQRESFFMRIMGDFYDFVSDFAIPIVRIGTPVFFVLLGLTFVCHWSIVCNLFSIASGFSILFLAYIISVIFIIDRLFLYQVFKHKPPKYLATVIWGIALILAGIGACILPIITKNNTGLNVPNGMWTSQMAFIIGTINARG